MSFSALFQIQAWPTATEADTLVLESDKRGVEVMVVKPGDEGETVVLVDERRISEEGKRIVKTMCMSQALAVLIEALAADLTGGDRTVACVVWRSRSHVAGQLTKELDEQFTPKALSNAIWRLRKHLLASGLNSYCMENVSSRNKEYRVVGGLRVSCCAGARNGKTPRDESREVLR